MIKKILLFTLLIVVLFLAFLYFQKPKDIKETAPIIEKKEVADEEIIIDYPKQNDIVTSPFIVRGKAKGSWYFEGDFPITFYYGLGGDESVDTYATAKGEWMTEDYVDFEVTIEFPKPDAEEGVLILTKNNPSDIEALNDERRIYVKFE